MASLYACAGNGSTGMRQAAIFAARMRVLRDERMQTGGRLGLEMRVPASILTACSVAGSEEMRTVLHALQREASRGPKGPPSAPPSIPPIIINPFNRHQPAPAIDPRITPPGPPVRPPRRPDLRI
jgi:hypothetical protein